MGIGLSAQGVNMNRLPGKTTVRARLRTSLFYYYYYFFATSCAKLNRVFLLGGFATRWQCGGHGCEMEKRSREHV